MRYSVSRASIEIRAEKIMQLFDTLDPLPYPQKDLAETTENFIVGWARELPRAQPIEIVVHVPAAEATGPAAQQLGNAFATYFRYRADRLDLDLSELFRIGRWSLLIGMAVLALCMILGRFVGGLFEEGYFRQFFKEGLIILGWVANWRPIEIFLYEWWPLVRRQKLYRRLSAASVEVRSDANRVG
ncbi:MULTISPECIES: hypothetical protein [unclassified Bradyrhizobium]|uniref:hypothetical protein n=1 Tax=unclassified Bradyrhizobium TaxID=2631580 RepID=UPI002449EBF2|nr:MULTISPECIES: hypothetical protein [unclassified Bradyrhizobium]MDH2344133.1 hypothetical protein [Bradyrhizobium sp. SSUT77]MDH2350262.1 hypothetical protein [Bradyrhizobium sp. SSUT112]